ncbi:hypothetical protein [Flavobacterium sp. J27]|uniref:hypothetical protein n=1 Tax=Flavobacterium sp. J27 TaxID=2060419 RepID=UPI0010300730|nr:hypothetical protein [Flavobacterium sp. J27]
MGTEDKLYKKIQQAAENTPSDSFPSMEKIWSRVEEKLETNVLKKEKNNWKKISVAASIIIVLSILYNFNKNESKNSIEQNTFITTADSLKNEEWIQKEEVVAFFTDTINKSKKDTLVALEKEIIPLTALPQISLQNENVSLPEKNVEIATNSTPLNIHPIADSVLVVPKKQNNSFFATQGNRKMEYSSFFANSTTSQNPVQTKNKPNPLVVINGEVDSLNTLKTLNSEEIDSIYILSNPLYIINGVEYTEESLFGKNPTSPYYPLDQQKIIATTILYKEEGEKEYGKKGKEGVVIIKTKNGKPNQN